MKRETMLARIERAYARVSFYSEGVLRDLIPYRFQIARRNKLFASLGDTLPPRDREDLISLLVLHKYFVATGLCPAESFTDQLFDTD